MEAYGHGFQCWGEGKHSEGMDNEAWKKSGDTSTDDLHFSNSEYRLMSYGLP